MKRKISKIIISFLLTMAMVVGLMSGISLTAYAAPTEELLTTITATGKEQASYSTANVATVSFSYTANGYSRYTNNGTTATWGWWGYGWTATVTPADGYTITKCVFYDDKDRTATDSEAPFVVETTEEDKTPKVNGTPILANTSKGITKIEVYGYVTPATSYSVTITAGDNMTKTTGSGDAEQTGLSGAMTDVVYTADNGYYFPTDYSVAEVSGIKVTRDSYTQITVSGTPTADAEITLTAPTAKTDQTAPTGLAVTKASSSTTTDGKISGVNDDMEYQIDGATTWTAVGAGKTEITGLTSGTYKVRYVGTADKNASPETTVTIGVKEDQTAPTGLTATKASSSTATDGKISGVNDDMEYQIDGATTWTTVGVGKIEITGLTAGTYKVRYVGTADKNASPETTIVVGTKTDQTAPTGLAATKASSSTATDGKISGVNDDMEYQIDGATTWTAVGTSKTEITGLTAGTYKVRYVGTADKNASPETTVTIGVKEDQTAPTGLTATKASSSTATDGKISGVNDDMEYQIDGATTWTTVGVGKTEITGLTSGTYKVRYVGTADKNASPETTVTIGVKEDQTAPTGLTATKASSSTATDGKISGVNDDMEYQIDGATTWTTVGVGKTEITGLTSGTYKVRYVGTADKNASPETTVTIGVKEDQTAPTGLTATKASSSTATDGKISGVNDDMEYQIDGATTWTTVGVGKTEITGLTAGTYKVRYVGTADKNASPETTIVVGTKTDQTAPTGLAATKASSSTATDGKISGINDDMEYQIDGATTWTAVGASKTEITGLTAGTYKVRYVGTADKNASPETTVTIGVKEDQTAPTGLTATKASSSTATDGKISGVNDDMEYQIDGATTWTAVGTSKTEITGLTAGTYKVRYVGTADKNASPAVTVEVGVKVAPIVTAPTAKTLTYDGSVQVLVNAGITTGGTMNYAVSTNSATAPSTGWSTSIPIATDAGTYYVWYKVVGDANYNSTEPNSVEAKINPVDKTDLNTAIEEAEAYYESIKEDDVYAQVAEALKKAIDEAKKYTNDNVAEKEVKEAIDTIKAAKVDAEEGKKEADDTVVANEVADAINALPDGDEVEVTDKEKIEAARKAYDALTDDQKEKVPADTLKKLEDAEKALEDAEQKEAEKEEADTEAAKKVTDAINDLPASDKVATTDKAAIEAARKAYDALTEDQKKLVDSDTVKKLTDAEEALKSAENKKDEIPEKKYKYEWVDGLWYNIDGTQTYEYKGEWKTDGTGWWYEDESGWYPVASWYKIDGKWYYFDAAGWMASNEWIGGYWLSENGAWEYEYVGSWKTNGTDWWYEDESGWYPVSQWQKIDCKWYYFGSDGIMATDQYIGEYWVGSDGSWQ